MTAAELKQCFKLAEKRAENEENIQDLSVFDGYGLIQFRTVTVTKELVADLIRWQCFCFNGEIDTEALNEIRNIGRKKFIVV